MTQALMINFNKYVAPAIIETLEQQVAKFNEASRGAILLTTQGFDGDFLQESFFASLHSAQRRVDRYSANSAVSATDLSQLKHTSVKVAGGFGPIRFEPAQLTWLQKPTAEGIEVMSRNFAEVVMADQLNTGIAAAIAAIENVAAATNDVSATLGMDYVAINGAHAKFGDSSSRIVANVMNGTTYHKLVEKNIQNNGQLFKLDNIQIVDILGKVAVVTDAPALYEAGTPNKIKVLGLVAGGVMIHDGSDIVTNIDTRNGNGRIESTMQSDYSFGVGLKGYTWDEANGGKSPSDAALATGTNWDQVATDLKATAGVIAIADAAK